MTAMEYRCRSCAETIKANALRCVHCEADLRVVDPASLGRRNGLNSAFRMVKGLAAYLVLPFAKKKG